MTKLEKIKKWAEDNGYSLSPCYHISFQEPFMVEMTKNYNDDLIDVCQFIRLYLKDMSTKATIMVKPYNFYKDKDRVLSNELELDDFDVMERTFIPMNNVKRDEKLLKEYLENER